LTQASMAAHVGSWAPYFVAIAILFFAFSSIIGNYYYGETNIEFINAHKSWLVTYRLLVLVMLMFGASATVEIVWSIADLFMSLMAIINLFVIALLGGVDFKVVLGTTTERKWGHNAAYHFVCIEGLKNTEYVADEKQKRKAEK